jgi:hypothetical protein
MKRSINWQFYPQGLRFSLFGKLDFEPRKDILSLKDLEKKCSF